MTDAILSAISARFPVTPIDVPPAFSTMKASGMTFSISAFRVEGIGQLSVMKASGFLGLMKMDSVILTPDGVDMPLMSYDRMKVGGNDLLYLEFFHTTMNRQDLSPVARAGADALAALDVPLPDNTPAPTWYTPLLDSASLHKKFKKKLTPAGDKVTAKVLGAYLALLAAAPTCDPAAKREKNAEYVEGLLTNGGPSTNAFLKKYGPVITAELFRKYLFGTQS